MFEDSDEEVVDVKDIKPKFDEAGKRVLQRGEQLMWLARATGMVRVKPFMYARVIGDRVHTLHRFENMHTHHVQISESTKDKIHPVDVYWDDEQLRTDVSKTLDAMVAAKDKSRSLIASRAKLAFVPSPGYQLPRRGDKLMWKTRIKEGFILMKPFVLSRQAGQKLYTLLEDGTTESAKDGITISEAYRLDEELANVLAGLGSEVYKNKVLALQLIKDRAVRVWPELAADNLAEVFEEDDDEKA